MGGPTLCSQGHSHDSLQECLCIWCCMLGSCMCIPMCAKKHTYVRELDGGSHVFGFISKMYMVISLVSATECVWEYGVCRCLLSVL